jgi:hypothetical protein
MAPLEELGYYQKRPQVESPLVQQPDYGLEY